MPLTDEEIAAKAPRAHLDAAVYEVGKLGPYTSGQYLKWTEDSLRTPHANVENFVSLSEDKERVTIHKSGVYRITVRLEVGTDDNPREFILKPLSGVTRINNDCYVKLHHQAHSRCLWPRIIKHCYYRDSRHNYVKAELDAIRTSPTPHTSSFFHLC